MAKRRESSAIGPGAYGGVAVAALASTWRPKVPKPEPQYRNVELKAYIHSNENHADGDYLTVLSVTGRQVCVRVIHRKLQLGSPMGKYKYLVEFIKEEK